MTRFRRQLRQTMTIARRDFIATVFTPIFLLFLFAPLLVGALSLLGGLSASGVSSDASDKERIVAIANGVDARALGASDQRLRRLFPNDFDPPALVVRGPARDVAIQARAALAAKDVDVVAVLHGPLTRPTITYGADRSSARYLAAVADAAVRSRTTGTTDVSVPTLVPTTRLPGTSVSGRTKSAMLTVFGIFFLTLFLSGQVVGTMAEERNNKVIEILAAAVPLESVFLGKLLGMFGVAVLFVAFWGTVVSQIGALLPASAASGLAELRPAIGFAPFAILFVAYFTTAYLLLGSVFLGIGAQASSMREIQMLSLPITIVQVAMFALSSAAASRPGSWVATFAEVFPLSSPFAMAGHAANSPDVWPHLAAIAWQMLWVAIFITVGARLFRRGVLQSGSAAPAWKKLLRWTPSI